MGSLIDLTGQSFGRLVVISKDSTVKKQQAYWNCLCSCGKECSVGSRALRMGLTKSCGCLNNENRKTIGHNNKIDLVGKRFGRLEVIQDSGKRTKHRQIIWTCKCNCGTILEVSSGNLRSGNTLSCGCLNSYGEEFISRLLTKHDIYYATQITFPDLLDKKPLRFDFGIYKDNKLIQLIEYDGKQHYDPSLPFYSETMANHDRAKDEYCKQNNIPLLRIKREDLTNDLLERIMYENSIS